MNETTSKPQHAPELDLAALEGFTPATPLPWAAAEQRIHYTINSYKTQQCVAAIRHCEGPDGYSTKDDAAYIAAASNALPSLLSEVKRLRSENERLREALRVLLDTSAVPTYMQVEGMAAVVQARAALAKVTP